jgi:glucan phosphoethanolaminetransferase (alkaline phosphatase superfamily)
MPSFLRPANLFLLVTYLILSAVPFLPVLFGKPVGQPARIVAMEFIAWLTIWALFKRPAWFHWLLLPAFLALPTEIYLHMFYGQGISPHHLGIIAETSPRESLEFLGAKVWPMLLVMITMVVWWWASWRAARRTRDFDWNDISRWLSLAALTVGAAAWAYGNEFGIAKPAKAATVASAASTASAASAGFGDGDAEEEDDSDDEEESDDSGATALANASGAASQKTHWPKLPSWSRVPFEPEAFGSTWPFGLVIRGYNFWTERQYLADLAGKNRLFKFGAHQLGDSKQPQVVVMVIGESGRYDRWSLNGYERDTNPLLKKEPNVVMLPDVITAVSATRLSVPVIISRKPAMQSLKAGFSEKSFLTAFKEAGFKTYWLSNQISFGQFDTPVSVFAKEADVIQFMNLGGFTNNSNLDQILLDPLKNAINDPTPKKLIVLHTLGSHWNYSHRYPQEFDKWQPSLFGVSNPVYTDLKIKPQLNNSYDNSILYTDWFLSQVIGSLKASNQLTSLLYVADHGQTLYDGTCNLAFHGHNTQYEFHVPALMWYSDQYKEAYPAKLAQLQKHRKARLSTENMFHSLLDMVDLRYDNEHLEWSFLSSQFRRHKRYVDSYGWTNYDKATIKGDCREVIDKGKPLKQEQ